MVLRPKNLHPKRHNSTTFCFCILVKISSASVFGMTLISSSHARFRKLKQVLTPVSLFSAWLAHVVVVAVEVEDDSMSSRKHVVKTGEALSNMGRMCKPRTVPSTVPRIRCCPWSITCSPVQHVYTRPVSLSLTTGKTRYLTRRNH